MEKCAYEFLVSYAYTGGTGRIFIGTNVPITQSVVLDIERVIRDDASVKQVAVVSIYPLAKSNSEQ